MLPHIRVPNEAGAPVRFTIHERKMGYSKANASLRRTRSQRGPARLSGSPSVSTAREIRTHTVRVLSPAPTASWARAACERLTRFELVTLSVAWRRSDQAELQPHVLNEPARGVEPRLPPYRGGVLTAVTKQA